MKKIIITIAVFIMIFAVSSCKKGADISYPVQAENEFAVVSGTEPDKELADTMISAMAKVYPELSRNYGYKNEKPVNITFCTKDEFKALIGDDYTEETFIHNSADTVYMVSPSEIKEKEASEQYIANVQNSVKMIYLNIALDKISKKTPDYLTYGVNMYECFSGYNDECEKVVEEIENDNIPTLKELEKMETSDERINHSYTLVSYIINEYGYDKLCDFIKSPKTKKVFDKKEEQFEADWHNYAKTIFAHKFENEKETAHFIIRYDSADQNAYAEMVAILEKEYDRIVSSLGVIMPKKVSVSIFRNFDLFNRAMFTPQGGYGHLGETHGDDFFIVSANVKGYGYTKEAMLRGAVHEFVHTVVYYINENVPSYLNEGVAAYLAGQDMDFGDTALQIKWAFANSQFPDMEHIRIISFSRDATRYIYGYVLCEYIDTMYGMEKLVDLLKNDDYQAVFGKTEEQFYAGWVEWLKAEYCN